MVTNVQVQALSENSVKVFWRRLDIPEVAYYIVYYRPTESTEEQIVTTPSNSTSITVTELIKNVEYQFQVAAVAVVYEQEVTGLKSIAYIFMLPLVSKPTPPQLPGGKYYCIIHI